MWTAEMSRLFYAFLCSELAQSSVSGYFRAVDQVSVMTRDSDTGGSRR
jgi:hypothetical protein